MIKNKTLDIKKILNSYFKTTFGYERTCTQFSSMRITFVLFRNYFLGQFYFIRNKNYKKTYLTIKFFFLF